MNSPRRDCTTIRPHPTSVPPTSRSNPAPPGGSSSLVPSAGGCSSLVPSAGGCSSLVPSAGGSSNLVPSAGGSGQTSAPPGGQFPPRSPFKGTMRPIPKSPRVSEHLTGKLQSLSLFAWLNITWVIRTRIVFKVNSRV